MAEIFRRQSFVIETAPFSCSFFKIYDITCFLTAWTVSFLFFSICFEYAFWVNISLFVWSVLHYKGDYCYSNTITKFTPTFLSLISMLLWVAFLRDRRSTLSRQSSYRIESSQWTGFYLIGNSVIKGLNIFFFGSNLTKAHVINVFEKLS